MPCVKVGLNVKIVVMILIPQYFRLLFLQYQFSTDVQGKRYLKLPSEYFKSDSMTIKLSFKSKCNQYINKISLFNKFLKKIIPSKRLIPKTTIQFYFIQPIILVIQMKSEERADRTLKNPCNKSPSKYQFSFGKEQRFKQRILKTQMLDKFYELPSQISKRAVIFGREKRDCEKEEIKAGPTPLSYNPHEIKSTSHIIFAPGRQNCKITSAFYSTTVDYPGPGNYDPVKTKSKSAVSMAGRPMSNYSTISPGPKYNFQSTLLDRNKILSSQKRKGSCRIVLPTNKSRLAESQHSMTSSVINHSATQGMITHKGKKKFGLNGSHAIITKQERFKLVNKNNQVPGPGKQYFQSYKALRFLNSSDSKNHDFPQLSIPITKYHLNFKYFYWSMSFFSKTEIKQLRNSHERIIRIAVSNVPINPTIAITTSNKIHLFNESGDKHQYELSRSITPTCIEWHPFNPILAIGWDNGRITIWNEDTKAPKEEGKPHQDPIMLIKFNPTGNRMVTSDLTGTIGVWRGINLLAVYQKEWAITHCVFSQISLEGFKGNLGNLFLFAGRSGTVCLANDMNMCSDVCRVGGTIKALMFYQKQGSAIVITSNLLLVQFKINFTEKSVPEKKVKLSISGEPETLSSIWIGQSLLATCSNENMIRFWHLQADENYNLTVFDVLNADSVGINMAADKISSVVYDSRGRSLVAGTREGRLMFWKNMALGTDSPIDKDQWAPQPILSLGKQIQTLTVGRNNGVIVCKQNDGEVIIVSETKISARMFGNYKAILKGTDKIEVSYEDNKDKFIEKFTTTGHIKGFDLIADKLLYWTSKRIQILEIAKSSQITMSCISSIEQKALRCLFATKDLFIISTDYGFNLLTLMGQVKQTLVFPESQGKVSGIEINNNFLVCWTQQSYIRVFTLSSEVKQVGASRRFEDSKGLIGNIRSCAINANGKKVGVISNNASNTGSAVNHSFHIYDTQIDGFVGFDLGKDHIPVSFYWDKKEVRYFGIQAQTSKVDQGKVDEQEKEESQEDTQQQENEENDKPSSRQFLTFFYTNQTGIRQQDKFILRTATIDIFALKVPHFYAVDRIKEDYMIRKTTLHDFQRINHEDDIIKNSILNFSFHLTSGNLDQAYKSVKNIQNSAIWEKMAIMCVKSKRLDVAQICIGNMKFARGARSIREAKKEPEVQTQLAMVAIQLGMVDQAKSFYETSNRYDLYSKICQSNAEIEKAIQISQKYDRINLKNTYFNAAKLYQASSRYDLATQYYEKSNTHIKQVPRMYLEANKIKQLTDYIESKKDKKLYTWLGQYNQSIGNLNEAVKYYEEGESTSNLVRLYLSQNQVQQSIRICNSDSEPQACFLLARHLEKANMLSEAIHFYAKAQYYSQAVKIAITNQLDGEIMGLSMASPKEVAFRAASYFQRKGLVEKAIRLYKKAGAIKKSNLLAEKNGFTELISNQTVDDDSGNEQELIEAGDKQAINTKINALLEANKFERAVPLLISSKQYERALDICVQQNVPIHEDLIKKMIPEDEPKTASEKSKRMELMKTIAQKCRKQGSFEIASNLYIKVGDKITSLKCLIQLGDHSKVINFANMARSAQTYVLAANFLQTGDWHQNQELMKNIIGFYQKAKAFDNLAHFFQACSNVEIDQYRDYFKGAQALGQAIKYQSRSTSADKDSKLEILNNRKKLMEQFNELKQLCQSDPQAMINGCLGLLEEPDVEQSVRRGDLYGIIIEFHFEKREYEKCLEYLKKMKERGIVIAPYVDKQITDTVYKQLGITTKKKNQIEEEVIQDLS